MPDPTRPHAPPPPAVQPDSSTDPARPAGKDSVREVKDGAFDDSVAGEEDPGAGADTLVPRSHD